MAVKLRIELDRVNDDELTRLQKRLVDLRTEAGRLEKSLDLTKLARNARASGQALKDALDLRAILQNTQKELQKQEEAIRQTGDASETTVARLEELRQKQQQLAEQQEAATGRVEDAKARVDAINSQINATVQLTKETDENRAALERLKDAQNRLQSGSQKAIGRANIRDTRDETGQIKKDAAQSDVDAQRAASRQIIASIRARHHLQKQAEQELTEYMSGKAKERADLEKAMIAQAKQDEKELTAWLKQQERERTADAKQAAREEAAAKKQAARDAAEEKRRIERNRQSFIKGTIGEVKNQRARAGQLQQVQSDTARLENEDRSLQRRKQELEELVAADDRYQAELTQTSAKLEEVRDKLSDNDRAMRNLSASIDLTATDFERLRSQLQRTGASQEQINQFDNAVQQLNNTLLNVDTTKTVRGNKDLLESSRQAAKAIKDEEDAIRDLQRRAEQSKVDANKDLVRIEGLQQQRDELNRMADALRQAEKPTQEMISAAAKYERQAEDLTEEIRRLRTEQEKQAGLAKQHVNQANAALTNAEATGRLSGRTEELRHVQTRLGREMDNVDFRSQRTGARELFAQMGGLSDQTSKLTKEKRFLAKALIDSAQAWFLNTRASNEAFNVAQRIFSQNLALQAGIIGVVAAGAALVGVIKGATAATRAQAEVSEEAEDRLHRLESATKDVKTAFIALADTRYFKNVVEDISFVQERLADFFNDMEDGTDAASRETGSELRLFFKELARDIGLASDETIRAELRAQQELEAHNRLRRNTVLIRREQLKGVRDIEKAEEAVRDVRKRSAIEQIENLDEINTRLRQELALIYGASEADRERSEKAAEFMDLLVQKREQIVAQLVREREAAVKSIETLSKAIAEQRAKDDAVDNNQSLLDLLREQDALQASMAEKEATRKELEDSYRVELIGVSFELDRQIQARQTLVDSAAEDESIAEDLKKNEEKINQLLERESELKGALKGIDRDRREAELQRRVQIKAALDAIREQRKELLALADLERTTAQMRIAAATQIDELQNVRQKAMEKFGADSEKSQKATNDLIDEYEEELKKSSGQAQRLLAHITQMEEEGNGATDAAQAMRDKYQEVLEVVRTLSDELLNLKVSAPNDVAKAQADQLEARVRAIEAAFGQMQEQGLTSPADNIRGRISESDVSREVQRKRAAEFEKTIQKDFSKIVDELGGKLGRDPTTREINREIESRRRGFMRGKVTDGERLDARKDLSSRFIDSLESQKAIGKETAEALRQQLETESQSLKTQMEIKDAIQNLGKAEASGASDQAQKTAVNPLTGKPVNAINPAGKSSSVGDGMAALGQGVGQNVNSQKQLGNATHQAFEAMSQAFSGVANGQQQLANFLVGLAAHVSGQSAALQNSVAQTVSRGGAALRNV